ncbi:MAG TPA: hypothetical protein VI321_04140 [Burkholderiales bacterium]
MARLVAIAFALALAACASVPQSSSVGSSVAFRAGSGIVESIQDQGVAAPQASASIQGAPPGISVYDASTYNQPSYTYMSSARVLSGERPGDPPPGGVSARTDVPRAIVRMDDGTRQSVSGNLAGLRTGDRVQIAADGRVTRP